MKYYVHVSAFGKLPFWVVGPSGVVFSTFRKREDADKTVARLNDEPARNTSEYWFKALNKELAHVYMSPVTEKHDHAND